MANVIAFFIELFFYMLNVNKYIHMHIAASTYFLEEDVHTLPAFIVGIVSDFTVAAILGICIVYLLYFTGSEYYYIKGVASALVFWLLVYGAVLRLNIARIDPVDAGTNLVHLSIHILLGLIMSFIIVKLGIAEEKSLLK